MVLGDCGMVCMAVDGFGPAPRGYTPAAPQLLISGQGGG